MKLPKIAFFTLGSRIFNKTAKKESDLKIRKDQKEHRGMEKHSITYHTPIDHVDDLDEFSQYKDKTINR